jgi:hypothetical protein
VRPELVKGTTVLVLFITLIVASSILQPYPLTQSKYVSVDLELVKRNPDLFYGRNITSFATVEFVFYLHPNLVVSTAEGVFLQIRQGLYESPVVKSGDLVIFRGTFYNTSVVVHEFHILDYRGVILRSIPGVVLFAVMFFCVFGIDLKHLAFVPRGKRDA